MRAVIIGLVVVAIVLAGGTAYLLRDYLSSMQAELEAQKPVAPTTRVLVAASDMPVGTVINANNTEWLKWPKDEVPDGFIEENPDDNPLDKITKDKHLARRGFVKGQPITWDRLYKSDDPGFLRGSLAPGMRAVAVRTAADNAASGFILPNDRVDLLLTHSMAAQLKDQATDRPVPAIETTSETILEDLRVLAVDQRVSEFEGGAAVGKTILLEVTPDQAQVIETAKVMGTLTLLLRSAEEGPGNGRSAYTTDITVSPMLRSLMEVDAPAPSSAPAPAPQPVYQAPRPSSARRDIKIYRGGSMGAAQ